MNARDPQQPRENARPNAPASDGASDTGFNLSSWALRHQQLVIFLIGLATLFGVIGYTHLAQSEDPPFTFRTMVIKTYWPGATALNGPRDVEDHRLM